MSANQQEFKVPEAIVTSGAKLGLVLGSGLGPLVDGLDQIQEFSYAEIDDLPVSRVSGHAGKWVTGNLAGVPLLVACGRVHLYEGHAASAVASLVRFMHQAGCEEVILTNAAGTTRIHQPPGHWMLIEDQLNLTATSPLEGQPVFVDMSEIYCKAWRDEFLQCAENLNLELGKGVYAGLRGPQYESPAEIQMLRHLGADAVGMSTVLEAIQARALGLRVAGFSCLTNWAAGMGNAPLNHLEVTETGQRCADDFIRLLSHFLEKRKKG